MEDLREAQREREWCGSPMLRELTQEKLAHRRRHQWSARADSLALTEDGQDSIVDKHGMQAQVLIDWLQWVTVVEDVLTHPSDPTPLISHQDTRARSTLLRPPPAEASSFASCNKRSYCEVETCSLSSSCKQLYDKPEGLSSRVGEGISGAAL